MDKTPKTDKKLTPQILAMYLGCKIQVVDPVFERKEPGILIGVDAYPHSITMINVGYEGLDENMNDDYDVVNENENIDRVKPILRRLEDMTEEEARSFGNCPKEWKCGFNGGEVVYYLPGDPDAVVLIEFKKLSPPQTVWLLSKSFDLFGLIDNNEAIDAKTLNP